MLFHDSKDDSDDGVDSDVIMAIFMLFNELMKMMMTDDDDSGNAMITHMI